MTLFPVWIWREKSRSDKRGDIERNSTLAFSRWCVDSGNSPTKRPVRGNTVRKYLQSKVVEPQYPARDSVGKLSPFEPKLRQWLSTEHKKDKEAAQKPAQHVPGFGRFGLYRVL